MRHWLAGEEVRPLRGRFQQAKERQERRLAAAGRTGDCDVLAGLNVDVHVLQGMRVDAVGVEDLLDGFEVDE